MRLSRIDIYHIAIAGNGGFFISYYLDVKKTCLFENSVVSLLHTK